MHTVNRKRKNEESVDWFDTLKLLKFASLVFTNSADEDGGVVERKKKTALKRAAVAKYLKKVEDGTLDKYQYC